MVTRESDTTKARWMRHARTLALSERDAPSDNVVSVKLKILCQPASSGAAMG
jgi:hypothetical protein